MLQLVDQHGVGPGVDDERQPGGVPGLAGCFPRAGGRPPTSAGRRAAPRRASPRRCGTAAACTDQRQDTNADAPASRNAFANPPTVVSSSPACPVWQALSTTSGPGSPFFAQAAFSLTVVEPRYCGSTSPPRLRPRSSTLRVQHVVGVGGAVPREVQQVEPARAQQVSYAGRGRGHLAGAEPLSRNSCSCTGSVRAKRGSRYAGHSDRAFPARTRISFGGKLPELPANQPALGQEARLLLTRARRRLEVHQLPRDERLVGVQDQVVHLGAVLPQVRLHRLGEQLVEHRGADVLQLALALARVRAAVAATPRPRRRGSWRSARPGP